MPVIPAKLSTLFESCLLNQHEKPFRFCGSLLHLLFPTRLLHWDVKSVVFPGRITALKLRTINLRHKTAIVKLQYRHWTWHRRNNRCRIRFTVCMEPGSHTRFEKVFCDWIW